MSKGWEGWVCLQRSIVEWEWYDDINTFRLFIHCLLKANHKQKKWRGVDIKRGQFWTSLDTLSKETGLTVKQIRTSISKLQRTGELASSNFSRGRMITVCNYDKHQEGGKQTGSKETSKGQAKGRLRATTNNENNENNINTGDSGESPPADEQPKFNFKKSLIDLGVEPSVASQWLKVRRDKKASNTELAFKRIEKEISKTNWAANQVITLAVEKSWKGFEADWLPKSSSKNAGYDW